MIWRYILAWFPMMAIGIVNGVIREATYGKIISELRAHQVSTITGVLLLGLYMGIFTYFWSPESLQQALLIGFIWLGLTVGFEFIFGHQRRELLIGNREQFFLFPVPWWELETPTSISSKFPVGYKSPLETLCCLLPVPYSLFNTSQDIHGVSF